MAEGVQASIGSPIVSRRWLTSLRISCIASCLLSAVGAYLQPDALVVGLGLSILYLVTLLELRGRSLLGAARGARLLGLIVFFPMGVVFFAALSELRDPGAEVSWGGVHYFGLSAASQLAVIVSATKTIASLRSEAPPLWQRILAWVFVGAYVLAFLAVVLIPLMTGTLDDQRRRTREAAAVTNLRTINACSWTFAEKYPELGFPSGLDLLGPAGIECLEEGLLDGEEFDYRFQYVPGSPSETGAITTYTVTARPLWYSRRTRRSLFSDESTIIRYTEHNRPANADDPPLD